MSEFSKKMAKEIFIPTMGEGESRASSNDNTRSHSEFKRELWFKSETEMDVVKIRTALAQFVIEISILL